jgi:hypothetical protein
MPPVLPPEAYSVIVVGIDEDVALLDAQQSKLQQTPFD